MSISEKLYILNNDLKNIKQAIIDRGVSISGNVYHYPECIYQIKNISGKTTENDTIPPTVDEKLDSLLQLRYEICSAITSCGVLFPNKSALNLAPDSIARIPSGDTSNIDVEYTDSGVTIITTNNDGSTDAQTAYNDGTMEETHTNEDGSYSSVTTFTDGSYATVSANTDGSYNALSANTDGSVNTISGNSDGSYNAYSGNTDGSYVSESGDTSGNVHTQDVDSAGTVTSYVIDTTNNDTGSGQTIHDGVNTEYYAFDITHGFDLIIDFYIDCANQPKTGSIGYNQGHHQILTMKRATPEPWYGFQLRQSNANKYIQLGTQFETGSNTNTQITVPNSGKSRMKFQITYNPTVESGETTFICRDLLANTTVYTSTLKFPDLPELRYLKVIIGAGVDENNNPYRYSNIDVYEFSVVKI